MGLRYLQYDPSRGGYLPGVRVPFSNENYLYNNEQFEALSTLAKNDLMVAVQMDISASELKNIISVFLKSNKLSLSVIDLSNAPSRAIMLGWKATQEVVLSLVSIGHAVKNALLLTTKSLGNSRVDERRIQDLESWQYRAAPLSFLNGIRELTEESFERASQYWLHSRSGRECSAALAISAPGE